MKRPIYGVCLAAISVSLMLIAGCGKKEAAATQAPPPSAGANAPPPVPQTFPRGTNMQPPKMKPPNLGH